jgi:hypothetical protein
MRLPCSFGEQTPVVVGSDIRSVSVTDVNGDGNVDMITANISSNDVSVLVGDGHGKFAAQKTFAVDDVLYLMRVVDVNDDGKADLITANGNLPTYSSSYDHNISVLLGDGKGNFAQGARI